MYVHTFNVFQVDHMHMHTAWQSTKTISLSQIHKKLHRENLAYTVVPGTVHFHFITHSLIHFIRHSLITNYNLLSAICGQQLLSLLNFFATKNLQMITSTEVTVYKKITKLQFL